MKRNLSVAGLVALAMLVTGCAGLQKERYFLCPYDTVWQAALETVKDRPVTRKDKDDGVIETAWTEMAAPPRGFGIFGRDLFANKERARMSLELKRMNDVTKVSVSENRERWHVRGGVTQQAVKWSPVEPSQDAMRSVMGQLTKRVSEHGCHVPRSD